MRIVNKTYNIGINKTIVLISDIHYLDKRDIKHLNKVLDRIKKIKPDYICIPGDITESANPKDPDKFINWLEELGTICKVIISIGNHEYYISKKNNEFGFNNDLYGQIKSLKNIYVLDNENIIFDNINFMGTTFSKEYYFEYAENEPNFNDYLKNIKSNKKCYNVLLCHSPLKIIDEDVINKINVDLVLCGHMHGGMVPRILRPIIKHGGFISPTKKLFPKYTYGNKKINNTNIITTSGICVLPKGLGILTNLYSSEIVIIK